MADREAVRALEALTPWERPAFRAGLAALSTSVEAAAKAFAADVQVLSALAAQVPRCAHDETGATPWTSFRQEVAVARQVSGQAAAAELRIAMRLTSVLPHTLQLLQTGRITVPRARFFVTELEVLDDELAGQLDCDLAERVAMLAPWRIKDEVRRAALALDPDSAAVRQAAATAGRDVTLEPATSGQACILMTGPAVPLTRWYATLDARARALRSAGDPRTLAALRFDLAISTFPCLTHPPADQGSPHAQAPALFGEPTAAAGAPGRPAAGHAATTPATPAAPDRPARPGAAADQGRPRGAGEPSTAANDGSGRPGELAYPDWSGVAAAGLRLTGVEAASSDCRMSRPVQAVITVPVETALGLSNEPAWLDGYGWLDAPNSRQLLPDAELRQLCIDRATGQVLNLAERDVRPPPTPTGIRDALLTMATDPVELSDVAWRTEPDHDPSDPLRTFTTLRDRTCDGPTQPRTAASRCDQDHSRPHPHGPTAAWNLISRSRRTHQLKHYGWTPIRTATSTIWTSPAGQVVDVPHHRQHAPGTDTDTTGQPAHLPDPEQLTDIDTDQLTPRDPDLWRPWLPPQERAPHTDWTVLDGSDDAPPW